MTNGIANAPAEESPAPAAVGSDNRRACWLPIALAVVLLAGLTPVGISYRRWAWDFTEPGRFRFDVNRNFNFGKIVRDGGFLDIYEDQIRDDPPTDKKLDYPPLRLVTFGAWAAWTRWKDPHVLSWSPDYSCNAFLMRFNTTLELLGAVAAFLIVRFWLRECARSELPAGRLDHTTEISPWTGTVRGTLAFALLWFDPGVVLIAHGWPSPNMWVIPFFLWTVLLCLWNFWFIAGVIMGIGAMMQGQQLLAVGIFVLWPLFAGRPVLALRWGSGFVMTFALIASGWMLTRRPDINLPGREPNWPAVVWVIASVALLSVVGLRQTLLHRLDRRWPAALAGAAALTLLAPALRLGHGILIAAILVCAVALVSLIWFLSWPVKRYLLALSIGLCLLLCIPYFGGSTAWWRIGFLYGAERFTNVGGQLSNNLPTILQGVLGWNEIHDTAFEIPRAFLWNWPSTPLMVSVRQFLFTVYLILFAVAGMAIARQWRRRDANLLVALVLPWVLFFTILPQMSPRYAVFVAGVGAICIGRSVGMSLLVLLFSGMTIEQTALCMMGAYPSTLDSSVNPLFNAKMQALFEKLSPGASWAEVLAAAVFFYVACTSSRRRSVQDSVALGVNRHDHETPVE